MDTGVTNEQFAQCWSLDPTGDWKGFEQDNDGNGVWDVVQKRVSNQVNEIVCLQGPASQSGPMPLRMPAPLGTVKPYGRFVGGSAVRCGWEHDHDAAAGGDVQQLQRDVGWVESDGGVDGEWAECRWVRL